MVDAVLYLIEVWPSSLEVLLLLHADVFLMQNWAHVARVLSLLNATPSETRDTDFSRVRPYALDGLSGRLRQTLLLAAHEAPELRALAMRSCRNASGRVAALPEHGVGCLSAVPSGTRQLFVRFDAASPAELADARLHAFKERLLPALLRAVGEPARPGGRRAQAVLFVPSYFDFVRVRQLLRDEDVPFVGLSEYSEPPDVARARAALQRGAPRRGGLPGAGPRERGCECWGCRRARGAARLHRARPLLPAPPLEGRRAARLLRPAFIRPLLPGARPDALRRAVRPAAGRRRRRGWNLRRALQQVRLAAAAPAGGGRSRRADGGRPRDELPLSVSVPWEKISYFTPLGEDTDVPQVARPRRCAFYPPHRGGYEFRGTRAREGRSPSVSQSQLLDAIAERSILARLLVLPSLRAQRLRQWTGHGPLLRADAIPLCAGSRGLPMDRGPLQRRYRWRWPEQRFRARRPVLLVDQGRRNSRL